MLRIHHVNLGLREEDLLAQRSFLLVLGYQVLEPGPELADLEVHWFEAGDGSQIHLSIDPEHRPAARAHVAVEYSAQQLGAGEKRLGSAGHEIDARAGRTCRVVFVNDPAGTHWELRGPERCPPTPSPVQGAIGEVSAVWCRPGVDRAGWS